MLAIISKLKEGLKALKSLRLIIFILLILFGIVPVSIYSYASSRLYLSDAITQRITELQSHAGIISNLVVNSDFFAREDINELNSEISQVADVYKGRILIIDSNLTIVRDTYELEDNKTIISKEIIDTFDGKNSMYINEDARYVEITAPINDAESHDVIGVIFMSFSTENIYSLYDSMLSENVIFITIFSVISLFFAVLVTVWLKKPFQRLNKRISRISQSEDPDKEYTDYKEFELIANSYDNMIEDARKTEQSRDEFVSNVSHELKTPITSMKVLAESLVSQEDVPAELYREFMEDIITEIERVNNIINDLLTVVKTEQNVSTIVVSSVNINEFIEGILKTLRPIAVQRNIELVYESFRNITAEIDEVKLGMAINNLIENAIKYNFDDGWVRVSLNSDHKYFYIKVSDSGVGIPEELQDRIFERFYRVDQARSRETGGTGLGLAITRNIVLLHRGAIKVYSKEGQGSMFTVRIPLNFQA